MMRKLLLVLLTIGLITTAGCKKIAEDRATAANPFPESSSLHAPFDRFLRKMATDPRFEEFRRQARSDENMQEAGFLLAMQGNRRLDAARLEARATLVGAILEGMDEASCAQVARADPTDHQNISNMVFQSLEKLPQQQIDEWFDLSFEAAVAQLTQQPEIQLDPSLIDETVMAWMQSLPADQASRMQSVLSNLPAANDTDTCWAARTMHSSILRLDEPQRRLMSQILVLE